MQKLHGRTVIFSIFGQIEQVAAETLIERGLAQKIEPAYIPSSVMYDAQGRSAAFAVSMSSDNVEAFEEMIRNLRA